jgi:hypothetical protein
VYADGAKAMERVVADSAMERVVVDDATGVERAAKRRTRPRGVGAPVGRDNTITVPVYVLRRDSRAEQRLRPRVPRRGAPDPRRRGRGCGRGWRYGHDERHGGAMAPVYTGQARRRRAAAAAAPAAGEPVASEDALSARARAPPSPRRPARHPAVVS